MRRNRVMRANRVTVDQRKLEAWLDRIALVAVLVFMTLAAVGVMGWASVSWSIGLFTGWLLRHCLH